ncbi:Acetyl esterase/lipase [Actinacidiphila yanglinensis]|uniref:Acetyl esterase/lipase n=1 Tax=Actinacidiphila yanglinensis TaxID=310779 RepID=A0A1H5S9D4_9ACTN|nr:alpha/beta hydrolase [Actinacidiphila yanglinensis]SEF47085.1 Acetyl esterase/lipase [Actinacidiphila yanglinensis]
MPSTQSGAVAKLYRTWLAGPGADEPIHDQRQWDVLTAEPGGVDYLETAVAGQPALWAVPHGCATDRVLLCVHGGGFVSGSIHTHRKMFAHLAKATGVRALLVGYPLLPEGAYPVPVDRAFAGYRALLDEGVSAGHIALAGDSAGAGPLFGAQLRAREAGLPLPAATLALSPWVDMEVVGATMETNREVEALFNQPWVGQLAAGYLAGADPRDPHANALHADITGFGPVFVQVGAHEVLLDDSRRLAEHAEKAGVEVRLDVFPEMQHTFQMMAGRAPEADDAIGRLAAWLRPLLGL